MENLAHLNCDRQITDRIKVIKSILDTYLHLSTGTKKEVSISFQLILSVQERILELEKISQFFDNNANKIIYPEHINEISATIGARIQLARENLGLSEADLARQFNTYSNHISDWECSAAEPSASQIIPLANTLKCDPVWLLTGKNLETIK